MLLRLAAKQAWREKASRECKILGLALWLSVFAVTVLSCLTISLSRTINKDAANLLGADLIAEASHPIETEFRTIAEKEGLEVSAMTEFFSMAINKDKMQLANIAAIENQYPLRGNLTVEKGQLSQQTTFAPPPLGEIWCDEDLMQRLDIKLQDEIALGDAKLIFSGIIRNRPVATSDSSVLAPIAYVNAADLPKLNVLQPGSRATYRLLFAGTPQQLAAFRVAVEKKSSDIQWVTTQSGRPAVNRTLTDIEQYIAVILLIQVLMAAIAIAVCAHQYSIRQRKQVVIWRSIGASTKTIVGTHVISLLLMGVLIILISVLVGYGAAQFINQNFLAIGTPVFLGFGGIILGGATGCIILIGFGLPPLLELRKISPIQILQRNPTSFWGRIFSYGIASLLLGVLLTRFLGKEGEAISISFAGKMLGIGIFAFIIFYGIWQLFLPLSRKGSVTWRLGISYLARHQWQTITQYLVFTLVLTLLLLVQIIRYDFVELWKSQLSKTTPNYFLINIQPEQITTIEKWFISHGVKDAKFYPIVRGRMIEVNGVRIGSTPNNSKAPQGLKRPINLTWMNQLPSDNHLISGLAWDKIKEGQALISVEKSFADRQHLKLGDVLGFEVANQEIRGEIVSFRTVNWESFKPNFFVIFPPGVINNFPHSYFTSVYISPEEKPYILDLAKTFVEISIIDIDAVLSKVREMVTKVAYALNGLLVLVFILGVLIMYANLVSTLKERLNESAMLRILGAKKKLIGNMLITEFLVLGIISGLMSGIMAIILSQELAQHFFALPFEFHLKWLFIGVLMGVGLITLFGLLGTREIFRVSPLWLFRRT